MGTPNAGIGTVPKTALLTQQYFLFGLKSFNQNLPINLRSTHSFMHAAREYTEW